MNSSRNVSIISKKMFTLAGGPATIQLMPCLSVADWVTCWMLVRLWANASPGFVTTDTATIYAVSTWPSPEDPGTLYETAAGSPLFSKTITLANAASGPLLLEQTNVAGVTPPPALAFYLGWAPDPATTTNRVFTISVDFFGRSSS